MTSFERGYEAFLKGVSQEKNPFDGDTCPYSHKHWGRGWERARSDRRIR